MRLRHLILAVPALAFGCAHGPSVTSERVVQLPPEARQEVVQAQQSVDTANQNVVAGKVAVDESKQFEDIADRELDAAKAKVDAAQKGIALGKRHDGIETRSVAQHNRDIAMRELFAARAKKDYAGRLVDLRKAELDQRKAELDLAKADFEYMKFSQLRANGMGEDLSSADFEKARAKGQQDVASARMKVANLQGSVEQLRTAWLQRAREYQTASRTGDIMPPPAPQPLENPNPPLNNPPPSGINEGPSSPQSVPQY
jgi:colicin import membrane protein